MNIINCVNCSMYIQKKGLGHEIEYVDYQPLPGWYHTIKVWGGRGSQTKYSKKCNLCDCKKPKKKED